MNQKSDTYKVNCFCQPEFCNFLTPFIEHLTSFCRAQRVKSCTGWVFFIVFLQRVAFNLNMFESYWIGSELIGTYVFHGDQVTISNSHDLVFSDVYKVA